MMELGDRPDLAQKPLGARAAHILPQHLDRDATVMPEVFRQVDNGHPAVAKLLLDLVTAGQLGAKACTYRVHGSRKDTAAVVSRTDTPPDVAA